MTAVSEFTGRALAPTASDLTVEVVSAFVARNSVPASDVPKLIASVHAALVGLGRPAAPFVAQPPEPAVPVKKSVTADHIICLEDGKKFRSLRRHLSAVYGMTPDEYRTKWGLPADYPMVAASYSEVRSKLAKDIGLGHMPNKPGQGA